MAAVGPQRGRIKLQLLFAFTLLARLEPRVQPADVLRTTEGLERMPSFLCGAAAAVAFAFDADLAIVALAATSGAVFGKLMTHFGLFIIPGILSLSTVYGAVAGYGLFSLLIAGLGCIQAGILGAGIYVAARGLGILAEDLIELWLQPEMTLPGRVTVTSTEISFFRAYQLHALRIGVPYDLAAPEEELCSPNWVGCYLRFKKRCPDLVSRFADAMVEDEA